MFSPESLNSEAYNPETGAYKGIAHDWKKFLGEKGRQDRATFLTEVLKGKGCKEVFDAALGTGGDTISLKKEGFLVTSNEIDNEFLMVARETARNEGVELGRITNQDWRNLSQIESGLFDAVVLLGNSLTHLFTRKDQLKALSEFYRILRYGGGF